ncbi:hypothetical protein LCGC14_2590030, partial [marine sediment metagenome]
FRISGTLTKISLGFLGLAAAGAFALSNLAKDAPNLADEFARVDVAIGRIKRGLGREFEGAAGVVADMADAAANFIDKTAGRGLPTGGTIGGGVVGAGVGSVLGGAAGTFIGGHAGGLAGAAAGGLVGGAIGTGWTDKTNGDPVFDILSGNARIQTFNYNTQGGVMILHPNDNRNLLSLLITTKGSSIPAFSSQKVVTGTVMELLGWSVVVTTNVTKGNAYMFLPGTTIAWRQFEPLSAVLIPEPKIGSKIRVSEEGEALLEHPR